VKLLDNTRKIERLLHNNDTGKVVFSDICRVMSDVLESNILVISKKGKVLGFGEYKEIPILSDLITDQVGTFIDAALNERFLGVLSTNENVILGTLGFVKEEDCSNVGIIAPIEIAGERLGTVFIYNNGDGFDIDDIILCEYGATVVSLEIQRSVSEEAQEELRRQQIVKSALHTMSISETDALRHIFDELDGPEGMLVASRVADQAGITRSVIVNALRKLESAGVIESRSSGMKGTYIKVLNTAILQELQDAGL
jgi:transcriptional pleiotropic repressor